MNTKQLTQAERMISKGPIAVGVAQEIAQQRVQRQVEHINRAIIWASENLKDTAFVEYESAEVDAKDIDTITFITLLYTAKGWTVSSTSEGFRFAR